jgi:CBS domain-containing protein
MKKASDIMTKEPASCTPETDLQTVARMMVDHDCGEIPVVESEDSMKPVGVVTDRDITCRLVAEGKNPLHFKAKDAMSSPCITVRQDTSLEECLKVMQDQRIRRVPVIDENGNLCGIVAQADIALKTPSRNTADVVKQVSKAA